MINEMTETSAEELEAFKAIRRIAAVLVTSSQSYTEVLVALESPGSDLAAIKKQALGIGLLAAQIQISSLEALPVLKKSIDGPFHPPLSAILALGAISSSAILIASGGTKEALSDLELLSLDSLQRILASKTVDNWLQICLGSS
jgi:hypothetical protein